MPWIGAAITAVGGFLGQEETNDTNIQIAQQNSAFNAQEAALTRDFNANEARITRQFNADQADIGRGFNKQEAENARDWLQNMSNSSYQRAIKDMQAAGLNPMLAYSQGGASTPGGPAASASSASGPAASGPAASAAANPVIGNRWAAAAQSAGAAAQIALAQAQARDTNASAAIKESEVTDSSKDTPDSATASLKRQQAQESANRQLNITADTTRINQLVKNLGEQLDLTKHQVKKLTEEILNLKEQGRGINLDNLFRELDIPRAHREHEFEESTVGRNYRLTEPIINQAGRLLHGAGQAQRLFNRGGRP